ncbi:MAG: hypothetical protein AAGK05_16870 [Pseudomonadota bacterium]
MIKNNADKKILHPYSHLINLFQFDVLEDVLVDDEKRSQLRHALIAVCPKRQNDINPTPLSVARAVCRSIAGDEVLQFFSRDRCSRSTIKKAIISDKLPYLSRVVTAVIVHNAATDVDTACGAFGRHLSKCSDRACSKVFLAQRGEQEDAEEAEQEDAEEEEAEHEDAEEDEDRESGSSASIDSSC